MEDWLKKQREYQQDVYGVDYAQMWKTREVVDYVSTMLTAAQIEIAEAFQEVPWKPWAQLTDDERLDLLREKSSKVQGELVDVLFFVANALVAIGSTDLTLQRAYADKMGVNKQRQLDGYDGVSTKCGGCGRALDEPFALTATGLDGREYCGTQCAVKVTGGQRDAEDVG